MIHDHTQTTDLNVLQVVAAESLLHRSLANEIQLTANNLQLQNAVQSMSQRLAVLLNTDIAGLNNTIAQLELGMQTALGERDEALGQFGVVSQREGMLKTKIKELEAEAVSLRTANDTLLREAEIYNKDNINLRAIVNKLEGAKKAAPAKKAGTPARGKKS